MHVAGDISKLGSKLWEYAASVRSNSGCIEDLKIREDAAHICKDLSKPGAILALQSADTAYATVTCPGPKSYKDPELAALSLAINYLCQLEVRFLRAVAGKLICCRARCGGWFGVLVWPTMFG